MRAAFKEDSVEIHRQVAHCRAVVGRQLSALQVATQSSSASGVGTSAPSGEEVGTEEKGVSSPGLTVRDTELKRDEKE